MSLDGRLFTDYSETDGSYPDASARCTDLAYRVNIRKRLKSSHDVLGGEALAASGARYGFTYGRNSPHARLNQNDRRNA